MPSEVRKVAHTMQVPWQQAIDYGIIDVNDLTPEQLAQYQREQEAAAARAADRELRRRTGVAEHGDHDWWVNLDGVCSPSLGCRRCGADAPVDVEESFTASLPVSLRQDEDGRWEAVLRVP